MSGFWGDGSFLFPSCFLLSPLYVLNVLPRANVALIKTKVPPPHHSSLRGPLGVGQTGTVSLGSPVGSCLGVWVPV